MQWTFWYKLQIAVRLTTINLGHVWKKSALLLVAYALIGQVFFKFSTQQILGYESLGTLFGIIAIYISSYGNVLRIQQRGHATVTYDGDFVTLSQSNRKIICNLNDVSFEKNLLRYRIISVPGGLIAISEGSFESLRHLVLDGIPRPLC